MNRSTNLNNWQKKQATLLYHFSSLAYLIGLRDKVNHLKSFAESRINQSRIEGRDRFLHSARWGDRDTTENWSSNAWQFLADFQLSVMKAIVDLPSEIYHVTGTHQCARGMSEYSMQWATIAEEEAFDALFASISTYARYIDYTMQKREPTHNWSDFGLTMAWTKQGHIFHRIPQFRVLEDLCSDTNTIPPRTGVYVSLDDLHAPLQFAWTGPKGGKLLPSKTFNDLGIAALNSVGRKRLWTDEAAMYDFILANISHPALSDEPYLKKQFEPALAPSLVASHAFTSRSSRWCFVELIKGEFEAASEDVDPSVISSASRRFSAGDICNASGYYFTPASLDSRRRFISGEVFPNVDSGYGKTIWQWDNFQD